MRNGIIDSRDVSKKTWLEETQNHQHS